MNLAKVALFAGGALFGSAGIEILTSKDAKKLYTQCTAAAAHEGQRHGDCYHPAGELR